MLDTAEVNRRFDYHRPDETAARTHGQIRFAAKALAVAINELVPEGREKALAITNVEQAMFWANAAIARDLGGENAPA